MKIFAPLVLSVLLLTPVLGWVASRDADGRNFSEAEALVGLWGAEHYFAPSLGGTLRVVALGDNLIASIAGRKTPVQVKDQQVNLTFPDNAGSFRGAFANDRRQIVGHWVQAAGTVENYQFATPLTLERTADNRWRGVVRPFQEQLKVYLLINKEPDGLISVVMRNPERNIGLNFRLDHVLVDDDVVTFHDYTGEVVLTGVLHFTADEQPQVDSFAVRLWGGKTFDFTRRERRDADGFYPRANLTQYQYTPPDPLVDGWPVAAAGTVGVREQALQAFVQHVLDTPVDSHRSPYIQDVVIARHGKLILDEHFFGFHGDIPHDSRSAGKSITSMLVGAAVDEGAVQIQDSVYRLFPESTDNPDPRKADLTVEHLLTMTSGYACDDNDPQSPGNEGHMQYQGEQTDWLKFTLDLPMHRSPGETGVYCSGGINLLAGIVSRTTGEWLPEFFRSRFAEPLGIERYHMNLDPLKRGYGGGGLRLRPRDFLKFGQIMLNGGRWHERRVLPASWVRDSLTPRSSINGPQDYGYAWWRTEHQVADQCFVSWSATGNGGQLLIIVPAYDLVLAFNGGNYNNFPTWIAWRDELMPALIRDAIM